MRQVRRIGMFVHVLDDRAVSRLNLALCRRFSAAGIDTVLIAAHRDSHKRITVPDGVAVRSLDLGSRPTSLGAPRLAALLRSLRLDVLFAHGNGPNRTAIVGRMLARSTTRIVTVEHNHYPTFYRRRRWLRDPLTAVLYPRADRVTGVSSGVVADLEWRFPGIRGKTAVLPSLGPDPAKLSELVGDPPDHPWYAERSQSRLICCVANVVPRKGQDTLVEALPGVRGQVGDDVRLVLVGRVDDPAFAARLQQMSDALEVRPYVWLAGYRDNALPFIARADVFALASLTEGAPMVLTEAMACGVPVVSTDCPAGPAYLLEQGDSGLLVPVRDPGRMAAALVRLLTDGPLRQELIARGRERANHFTPDNVAQQYLRLASQTLDDRQCLS